MGWKINYQKQTAHAGRVQIPLGLIASELGGAGAF
jgi:hypothetical protein